MWVYKQDSLRNRLQLAPALGHWLDYWLFLHSEETHPVWSNRPLGLLQLALAAQESTAGHDYTLRVRLAGEALAVAKLGPFLTEVAPPPACTPLSGSSWDPKWLNWFDLLAKTKTQASVVADLAVGIHRELANAQLPAAHFLTRRLSAEVTEDDWSHHERFIAVKRALCDGGTLAGQALERVPFADTLVACLGRQSLARFTVVVRFAPTPITQTVARAFPYGPRLLLDKRPDEEPGRLLTGIEVDVEAPHVGAAAASALDSARQALDRLRLSHYVRTHLSGSVEARPSEHGEVTYLSLPQPFWSKAPGRRKVPALPAPFTRLVSQLPEDDASRWNASHWHLSQALADWAEDSHTAAAHVWQALEAFAPPVTPQAGLPPALSKVLALVPDYLRVTVPDMGRYLATHLSLQTHELRVVGQRCDWYFFVAKRVPFENWMARVLDSRSSHCHTLWRSPVAPAILFNETVGLLRIVNRRLRNDAAEAWMERRLEADLGLLYGVRNKAVHSGRRVLSRRSARYLGQLGIELLLGVMAKRAALLPRSGGAAHGNDETS